MYKQRVIITIDLVPFKLTQNIERKKCIILNHYIMTEKFRNKKDDNPSDKNSNEIPNFKDYKSKEE